MNRLFLFLLLILGGACFAHSPLSGSPDCATRTSAIALYGDSAFSPTERAQIQAAADDWREWSHGRIRLSVTWFDPNVVLIGDAPMIVRHATDSEVVSRKEAELGITLIGWQTDRPFRVNLVPDRVQSFDARNLAAHELGHAAGLKWPDCEHEPRARTVGTKKDCLHNEDPNTLMSAGFNGLPLQPIDLELCRASCLCD